MSKMSILLLVTLWTSPYSFKKLHGTQAGTGFNVCYMATLRVVLWKLWV